MRLARQANSADQRQFDWRTHIRQGAFANSLTDPTMSIKLLDEGYDPAESASFDSVEDRGPLAGLNFDDD